MYSSRGMAKSSSVGTRCPSLPCVARREPLTHFFQSQEFRIRVREAALHLGHLFVGEMKFGLVLLFHRFFTRASAAPIPRRGTALRAWRRRYPIASEPCRNSCRQ